MAFMIWSHVSKYPIRTSVVWFFRKQSLIIFTLGQMACANVYNFSKNEKTFELKSGMMAVMAVNARKIGLDRSNNSQLTNLEIRLFYWFYFELFYKWSYNVISPWFKWNWTKNASLCSLSPWFHWFNWSNINLRWTQHHSKKVKKNKQIMCINQWYTIDHMFVMFVHFRPERATEQCIAFISGKSRKINWKEYAEDVQNSYYRWLGSLAIWFHNFFLSCVWSSYKTNKTNKT